MKGEAHRPFEVVYYSVNFYFWGNTIMFLNFECTLEHIGD